MFASKRRVRLPGAVLALIGACFSTHAHAGYFFPLSYGVGADSNGWGMSPQQGWNMKLPSPLMWGIRYPGGSPVAAQFGMSMSRGFGLYPYEPMFGINSNMSYGIQGPFYAEFGINPYMSYGFQGPISWGMSAQPNVGLPYAPWMSMGPNPSTVQPASPHPQAGFQGVQCTVNGVGVLTKDADDCERADGEIAKATSAKQ